MHQFIEDCRREWKRLRVPDPVADEMAADLAADLEEAESEGASPEDVLGIAASDPRSFAASWAAERAVIPTPRLTAGLPKRSLTLAAIAAVTIIAAIGAGLVLFASPHRSADLPAVLVRPANVWVEANSRVAIAAPAPLAVRINPPANGSVVEINGVGSILLIVGIVGMILATPFVLWSSRPVQHWPRQRA